MTRQPIADGLDFTDPAVQSLLGFPDFERDGWTCAKCKAHHKAHHAGSINPVTGEMFCSGCAPRKNKRKTIVGVLHPGGSRW